MELQASHQFSHVYVEEDAWNLPQTEKIIARLRGGAPHIMKIGHYGEIFNRPRQRFTAQKKNPALILALEHERFLYEGNERINSWAQSRLFYNALVRNCVYNCEYCFLQGMHASAHTLMFVNNHDFIDAAARQAGEGPMYLSISYLSDILAFEPLYPYCAEWIDFAAAHPQVGIEIRSKSDYYQAISQLKPVDNVFLVWSLSPGELSSRHERGCASFQNRLFAASRAAADGWPIKLSFDPVLAVDGWEKLYPAMLRETFERIPAERVREVSFGLFRMNPGYLKKIQQMRPASALIRRNISNHGNLASYSDGILSDIRRLMEEELSKYMSSEKIFFVHG